MKTLLQNERGNSLILVIIILFAVTMAGMLGLTETEREIQRSGVAKFKVIDFYHADAGISAAVSTSGDWLTDSFLSADVTTASFTYAVSADIEGTTTALASVTALPIQDLNATVATTRGLPFAAHIGIPPAGSGFGIGKFQTRRYALTSVSSTTDTTLQVGVWKIFNK